jgi:hypothetical protein
MDWKLIETAPKDGTQILLLVDGVTVQASWGVGDDGDYNNPCWNPTYTGAIWDDDATHWMPLPPPLAA